MRRRAAALAVPLTALSLVVSSCGSLPEEWRTPAFLRMGEDELDSRLPEVSGEVGEAPDVVFPDQEPPDEPIDGIVQEGAGEDGLVRSDDLIVANVATFQWTGPGQGETVEEQSSYETGAPDLIRMAEMPEEITSPLVSQPIGSRAVYVMPEASPEERAQAEEMGQEVPEGATVLVIDLMERFGTGAVVPGQQTEDLGEDMPTVAQDGHSEPEITIPEDEEAPDELVTEHLIEGDGDEVEEGQQVIVQYTGVQWEPDEDGNHEPFDSSWANGGAPVDFAVEEGSVIQGWVDGLVGQKVGSRLLLAIPGDLAYGDEDTGMGQPHGPLVFVVDLLGAYDAPPPPEEGEEGGEEAAPEAEEAPDEEVTEEEEEDDED